MLLKVVPERTVSADAKTRDPMWDNAALQTSEGVNFIARFLGRVPNFNKPKRALF